MLSDMLRSMRMGLRQSRTAKRLAEWTGVNRLGKALYYRSSLRAGVHTIHYRGQPIRFAVTTRREVDRLDYIHAETPLIEQLLAQVQPGGVLFDIGANIGVVSLIAARLHPDLRVHAFEPMPENLEHLRANIQLNDLADRVTAHDVALSDCQGQATFHLDQEAGGGTSTLVSRNDATSQRSITVRTDTLANVAAAINATPSVVKIDVEGAEWEVIRGMQGIEPRTTRAVLIEVHGQSLTARGLDPQHVAAPLLQQGFTEAWRSRRGNEFHVLLTGPVQDST